MITRLVAYPAKARRIARSKGLFHVVDHTYAQLVHALPRARTGVYCHDLDAFRLNLEGAEDSRALPSARAMAVRALGRVALEGVRSAAVVFHSTFVVRDALLRHGIVPEARLVHAPYGVASEFIEAFDQEGQLPQLLRGVPYVLHVGSGIARKRLDVLFDVCARSLRRWPELRLVQQGAQLSASHREQLRALGLEHAVIQLPKLDRRALAALYRGARALLLPSESEGFGLPVIEALACGTAVIASDIPVLREVGGDEVVYRRLEDREGWEDAVVRLRHARDPDATIDARRARAARFTWSRHARTILDAYLAVAASKPAARSV